MNLLSPTEIKNILKTHNANPKKYLGQNFLIDKKVLHKIIQAAQLSKTDTVLEVGPGMGVLTKELATYTKKVIAIEKDSIMVSILQENLREFGNVEIIRGDILLTTHYSLPTQYKIIANIPYYLTSALIRKFLETPNPPSDMVLMIQKEVAQRICAKPPRMSLLAVSVQYYANASIAAYVKKECFWPKPKVDSAITKITPRSNSARQETQKFFAVVKAGFSQPRKQLGSNLSNVLGMEREKVSAWLHQNSIDPLRRAETLSVFEWEKLSTTWEARA